MRLRTVKKLYYALFLVAVIVMIVGYHGWPLPVYIVVGAALLLAMSYVLQALWRCPLCGHQLGKMKIGTEVECPHCKKKLEV